jgi:hypothetical protein
MPGTLIAHAGANKISREELAEIVTPEATDTFRPIPHHELIDTLVETLSFRHIQVVQEEYAVTPDGSKMFGLIGLDATFLDCRFSIGVRNAHDKSMRLGLVAGYRVFVCDNMAFQGEFHPVLAKHSKRFNLQDALTIGVDRIQRNWTPLQEALERRRNFEITPDQARLRIYEAFMTGQFPIKLMKGVDKEFFHPQYEEFKPQTLWSLENAFTSTFKALKPVPQYQATAKLGRFISDITPPFN